MLDEESMPVHSAKRTLGVFPGEEVNKRFLRNDDVPQDYPLLVIVLMVRSKRSTRDAL